MAKINVSLDDADWEEILPSRERTKYSGKEFWYKKRNYILDQLHNLDLSEHTDKELMLANLEMQTKIYWELRKMNEQRKIKE